MNEEPRDPREESFDLAAILKGWPYRPGQILTRIIRGMDGRNKIQMRLSMGVIQMEMTGRPDGARPRGYESLLEFHQAKLREHVLAHGSEEGFSLSDEECEALRDESVGYYHRYMCCFQLQEFAQAADDTARNLRVADFLRRHAKNPDAAISMEQYRPYIVMMNARARAYVALERNDASAAARILQEAAEMLRRFYHETGSEIHGMDPEALVKASEELRILEDMLDEIQVTTGTPPPPGPESESNIESLQEEMRQAVEREDFERAAALRDRIRELFKNVRDTEGETQI